MQSADVGSFGGLAAGVGVRLGVDAYVLHERAHGVTLLLVLVLLCQSYACHCRRIPHVL